MTRQNPFDQKKEFILASIHSEQRDLSPKGNIDVLCMPIIDLINSHHDMVTTSSCSGRVSIFVEGDKSQHDKIKSGGKGEGGRWLFVTHDYREVPNWINHTELSDAKEIDIDLSLDKRTRLVLYKFEPFILHVKCRDSAIASNLYNIAMACGFRESGIGSNNLVAFRINIKLDTPIGYYNEDSGRIDLCGSKNYIKTLDNLSLLKFQDNARKMEILYNRIKNELF